MRTHPTYKMVCDNCNRAVIYETPEILEPGWIRVDARIAHEDVCSPGPAYEITRQSTKRQFDFCCVDCLHRFCATLQEIEGRGTWKE